MTKKKPQSILGLPPLLPLSPSYGSTSLVPYSGNSAITKREVTILENLHEDELAIEAYDHKSRLGLETMNELKLFAVIDFAYTAQQLAEVKQESYGTSCQGAVDEFCTYMTTLAARHTLGVVEIHGTKIAELVAESVVPPPPEPERPKGLLARLLGG